MHEQNNHSDNTYCQAVVLDEEANALVPSFERETIKTVIIGLVVLGLWGIANGKSIDIKLGQFALRIK